ncbi:hypothetical protein ANCCAN_07335 [Ancylostoma caninum]|uniref:Nucleotide-diphospho-sugar transferase domain-containing protein n=1 Tax=Ancylostoma caninum TaxID=29170 RepID=A0A368GTH5_ANCCA|nr:hypothetical protein ANCCAN_07335 [Ancylostoma caninum]
MSSKEFKETLSALPLNQETFVLILNVHALNMTLNWLCNTEQMPGFYKAEHTMLFQKPFNYGDGPYQLFYLFRANLARALIAMGRPFWMIQQDTFWAESLSSFNVAARTEDIIFDRASENGPMIAGKFGPGLMSGYYYAKPNPSSMAYFERLAQDISWWYAPDYAYMTSLCELSGLANCGGLPFSLITNWQWLDSKCSNSSPSFVQFDGETNLGGKLGKMKQLGFYFLQEDGRSCNRRAVQEARQLLNQRMSNWSQLASSSQQQFKFYQNVIDWMYGNPWTSWFLNRWMLPYGHYCMLSF